MKLVMFLSPSSIPYVGILFLFFKLTAFLNILLFYAELCILFIKLRSSSLNAHLLFESKLSIEKSIYLTTCKCKSNQPELYLSVSTLCLRTRIISFTQYNYKQYAAKKFLPGKNCCVFLEHS